MELTRGLSYSELIEQERKQNLLFKENLLGLAWNYRRYADHWGRNWGSEPQMAALHPSPPPAVGPSGFLLFPDGPLFFPQWYNPRVVQLISLSGNQLGLYSLNADLLRY